MINYLLSAALAWNCVVFILYGIDKYKAKHRKWRISELMLVASAYIFASIGAMLGMIVFNHKTSKTKFRVLIPLSFVFNIICIIAIKKWAFL